MNEFQVLLDLRVKAAGAGGVLWRNNVGATKAKESHSCPRCGYRFEERRAPVRYGLCNDSQKLNGRFKSADLVGIMPRVITPADVGGMVGQFAACEIKPPGWVYTGRGRETAQRRWLQLVQNHGGLAGFSTGEIPWL